MKMTPRIIVIGGLAVVLGVVAVVVFLPYAIFKPADTLYVRPYTELEQRGRDLYVANGCMYCHSQFTRKEDVTPSEPSEAGDFNYDKPHQLGTLRTGPDLANIGLKRGDMWEMEHFKEPRSLTPDSIMPSFKYLSDEDLKALVAYLNTLGNKQTASTNIMLPDKYVPQNQPLQLTVENWTKGRDIYAKRCLTCHGCAGKGDGPYAMINNARPADLRQERFKTLPAAFDFWRISEGVPGTVMPRWKQTLTEEERWLAVLFVQNAFMDMVPHLTDEGDLPAEFAARKNPVKVDPVTLDEGKAIYSANCQFCHGYGGRGNGVDAAGLLPGPPDFNDPEFYKTWSDGDWFWRVSESLPMRAMPQWKTWFEEDQLWKVANYVRHVLALPDPKAEPADPEIPERAKKILVMPADASVMRGRAVYLKRCWMCHGDAGQAEGPDGTHFVPAPADFTVDEFDTMPDYELMWKVSEGIGNTAMPPWRLLLSEEERWDAIAYIKATFVKPSEPDEVDDNPPVAYQALEAPYEDTPDARERGRATYAKLCAHCHGAAAKGDGKFGAPLMPTPADLTGEPASVSDAGWWYWRIDQGVVGDDGTHPTAMPAWRYILTEQERWEVVFGAREIAGVAKPVPEGGATP